MSKNMAGKEQMTSSQYLASLQPEMLKRYKKYVSEELPKPFASTINHFFNERSIQEAFLDKGLLDESHLRAILRHNLIDALIND